MFGSSHYLHEKYFYLAQKYILNNPKIVIYNCSKIYQNIGAGVVKNTLFYNMALAIGTYLHPAALLRELNAIEKQLGRLRPYKNAPRTIDIDIFLGTSYKSNILNIPHQDGFSRDFFIIPTKELFKNNHMFLKLKLSPRTFQY